MIALGEARKKLYEAYGDAVEDTSTAGPSEAEAKTAPVKIRTKPAKKAPATAKQRKEQGAPGPSAHNRVEMTRRLAARIAAEMPEGTVSSYIPLARVVLAELREPTTDMLERAFSGQLDYSDNVEDWQRMIDAALEEPDLSS